VTLLPSTKPCLLRFHHLLRMPQFGDQAFNT
jgi:hypothetical protein